MAKKESSVLNLGSLSIDAALEALNKKYGANTVVVASKSRDVIRKIPTGIAALDIALAGGLPSGRFIEFNGPFSSFKSTVGLVTSASFLRREPKGLVPYIDLEHSFDAEYAKKLGVDVSRVLIINPDSGEQAINLLNDVVTLNCPLFGILDSLAALVPSIEIESDVEQSSMGVRARLVNRMMAVLTARMKRDMYDEEAPRCTLLILNQLREKLNVMFGSPETTPGGRGKDFAYSVIVRLSVQNSKAIYKTFENNTVKREIQVGHTVGFKVVKNKCGGPQHEEGTFVYYGRDFENQKAFTFNNAETLFEYGCFLDVIEFVPKVGFRYEVLKAPNEKKFIAALQKNKQLQLALKRECIREISGTQNLGKEENDNTPSK